MDGRRPMGNRATACLQADQSNILRNATNFELAVICMLLSRTPLATAGCGDCASSDRSCRHTVIFHSTLSIVDAVAMQANATRTSSHDLWSAGLPAQKTWMAGTRRVIGGRQPEMKVTPRTHQSIWWRRPGRIIWGIPGTWWALLTGIPFSSKAFGRKRESNPSRAIGLEGDLQFFALRTDRWMFKMNSTKTLLTAPRRELLFGDSKQMPSPHPRRKLRDPSSVFLRFALGLSFLSAVRAGSIYVAGLGSRM